LKVMKLTALLLTVAFLQVHAKGISQVTLSLKQVPMEKVFREIERQTGYGFLYTKEMLADLPQVTIHVRNASVKEVLDRCFKGESLGYSIDNNSIVVTREIASPNTNPATLYTLPPVEIHGRVVNQKGEPLQNVSVIIAGTKIGTTTNSEGRFTVTAPDDRNIVLEISSVGYQAKKVNLGKKTEANITLELNVTGLSDVVVTALGIKREEKSLGYAVQKVNGEEVTKAPTTNWINALSGKVPGLQLNKLGGPMGSSDVVLRGDNVIALGGSTALIIIDGVPVSTQQAGTGYGALVDTDNPIDFGSSLSDLNPEDIESISVLKGPGAAALYGSRASNGAIIITTKSGRTTPGLGVFFNSSVTQSTVNRWPDYQYEYGAGGTGSTYYSYGASADGSSTVNSTSGFGPKYEGQEYFQYNSPFDASVNPDPRTAPRTERVPWKPYKNFVSGFFRPGIDITNTIGLSGSDYRASVSYTKSKWILPNTGLDRLNVSLSSSKKISSKITLNSKVNYVRKFSDNLPTQGYNNKTVMYFMAQTSNSFDIDWFKQSAKSTSNTGIAKISPVGNGYLDNPYVITNEMLNGSDRQNVIGNVNALIQINKKLSVMVRSGLDFSYEFRNQQRPFNTNKFKEGMYRQQNVYRLESNSDFLIKFEDKLPVGLSYSASLGGNQRFNDYKYSDATAGKLSLPGVYNLTNSKDPIQTASDRYSFMVNSLYGFVNLGYKDKVFLELTGRNDWSSTLPANNSSFFYPSVNTSVLLNQIFKLPTFISFAKVRASYASTGVDAKSPYGFLVNYNGTDFPGSLQLPSKLPNVNLKPQLSSAFETGLDLRFFENRLGIDVAVYKSVTRNQILSLPVDGATGFTSALTNVGKVQNHGVEVQVHGTPVKKKDFRWDVTLNWSANQNKVIDVSSVLGTGGQIILYNVSWANINIVAEEGKSLGQLYGLGFKRSPDGEIIYNNAGIPVIDNKLQDWGSISPNWQGSIQNSLRWKNFNFSFLLDVRDGGRMMSYTNAILSATGKLKNSLPGRDEGVVGKGVQETSPGVFVPNTTKAVAATYYAKYYLYSNMETNVFSTSFVKLREVSISYTLPKSVIKNTFVQELSFGLSGRDLFDWTKFPSFDPETATMNSSQIMPGIEIGQFPSTRSITLSLNAKF
ncbi:MAG: SusC/RagA family TonB-linked outer membrane protein, partial [Ginsengibacter sp.]